LVLLKKAGSAEPSFFAVISIFTPCGGIADLISTFSGKSGPNMFRLFELFAGVVSATRPASAGSLLFLQAVNKTKQDTANNKTTVIFFIAGYIDKINGTVCLLF